MILVGIIVDQYPKSPYTIRNVIAIDEHKIELDVDFDLRGAQTSYNVPMLDLKLRKLCIHASCVLCIICFEIRYDSTYASPNKTLTYGYAINDMVGAACASFENPKRALHNGLDIR